MAMVRPSTQQTVDRILGTAAILSLSVVLVRRLLLSSQNKSHYHHHHSPRRGQGRGQHQFEDDNNDNKWRWWGHYWLWKGVRGGGITSLQRRRDHDTGNKDRTEEVDHDKRMHEHSGSCHCGSIQFLVSIKTNSSTKPLYYCSPNHQPPPHTHTHNRFKDPNASVPWTLLAKFDFLMSPYLPSNSNLSVARIVCGFITRIR